MPSTAHRHFSRPTIWSAGVDDTLAFIQTVPALKALATRRLATFIEYPNAGHALQTPDQNHLPHFIAGLASWFDPTRATPK